MELQKSEKILYRGGPTGSLLIVWFFTKVLLYTGIFWFLLFWASGFFGGLLFLTFAPTSTPNILSVWGAIPFILPLFALGAFIYTYYLRKTYNYFVTSQRVVFEGGIIIKKKKSVPYDKITDIVISQTILEQIAGIRSLEIQTAGTGYGRAEISFVGLDETTKPQSLMLKSMKSYKVNK